MSKTKILTASVEVDYHLPEEDIQKAMRIINEHFCGEADSNKFVDGKWVAKYPEIEAAHPEWAAAHRNLRSHTRARLSVSIYSDGTYELFK